jgi:hypothetical protein
MNIYANSRFSQLRILWQVRIHILPELLSITKYKKCRYLHLREAAEPYKSCCDNRSNFKLTIKNEL